MSWYLECGFNHGKRIFRTSKRHKKAHWLIFPRYTYGAHNSYRDKFIGVYLFLVFDTIVSLCNFFSTRNKKRRISIPVQGTRLEIAFSIFPTLIHLRYLGIENRSWARVISTFSLFVLLCKESLHVIKLCTAVKVLLVMSRSTPRPIDDALQCSRGFIPPIDSARPTKTASKFIPRAPRNYWATEIDRSIDHKFDNFHCAPCCKTGKLPGNRYLNNVSGFEAIRGVHHIPGVLEVSVGLFFLPRIRLSGACVARHSRLMVEEFPYLYTFQPTRCRNLGFWNGTIGLTNLW